MEKVDLLSARGKSLGFTDTEIFCGLFSSSSCQCLFNSEGTVPLASHQVGRFPDLMDYDYWVTVNAPQKLASLYSRAPWSTKIISSLSNVFLPYIPFPSGEAITQMGC